MAGEHDPIQVRPAEVVARVEARAAHRLREGVGADADVQGRWVVALAEGGPGIASDLGLGGLALPSAPVAVPGGCVGRPGVEVGQGVDLPEPRLDPLAAASRVRRTLERGETIEHRRLDGFGDRFAGPFGQLPGELFRVGVFDAEWHG